MFYGRHEHVSVLGVRSTHQPDFDLWWLVATYYTATTGSDSNPGTIGSPFLTISHGISVLVAGDTLYVRGGTYHELVNVNVSGVIGNIITISGYPNETAIVDGQLTIAYLNNMVLVSGHDIIVQDLTVTQSLGAGIVSIGPRVTLLRIFSHHNRENGLLLQGNNNIADACDVWYNVTGHENGAFVGGYGPTWSTGLSAARNPDSVIVRHCTVRENWGEGLSTFEATNVTFEDNTVYDNWAANTYMSDCTGSTLQRNLIYYSPNFGVLAGTSAPAPNIYVEDETFSPASANNKIINNLVLGGRRNLFIVQNTVNLLVDNNDFIDANLASNVMNVQWGAKGGGHSGSSFQNNVVLQTDSVPMQSISPTAGITINHNAWYNQAGVSGTGDVTTNPMLTHTGSTSAGNLVPAYFTLLTGSPCIDAGTTIASITNDFLSVVRPRGVGYDIGGLEFGTSVGFGRCSEA